MPSPSATNRRDREYDRRHSELERSMGGRFRESEEVNERRFQQLELRFQHADETNERRHQEVLRAIGLLHHHVRANGSPAMVPQPGVDPSVPAPADN